MRERRNAGLLPTGLVLFAAVFFGVLPGVAQSPSAQDPATPSAVPKSPTAESPVAESPIAESPIAESPPAEAAGGEAPSPFSERCRREVEELHAFFESWFNGTVPDDDATFARFSGVLAEEFAIISPNGELKERQALVDALRASYHPGTAEAIRIWIENFRLRRQDRDLAVVTYEEWQERGGQRRGRVATAILREREGLPNGLEWLHVHETWLAR